MPARPRQPPAPPRRVRGQEATSGSQRRSASRALRHRTRARRRDGEAEHGATAWARRRASRTDAHRKSPDQRRASETAPTGRRRQQDHSAPASAPRGRGKRASATASTPMAKRPDRSAHLTRRRLREGSAGARGRRCPAVEDLGPAAGPVRRAVGPARLRSPPESTTRPANQAGAGPKDV